MQLHENSFGPAITTMCCSGSQVFHIIYEPHHLLSVLFQVWIHTKTRRWKPSTQFPSVTTGTHGSRQPVNGTKRKTRSSLPGSACPMLMGWPGSHVACKHATSSNTRTTSLGNTSNGSHSWRSSACTVGAVIRSFSIFGRPPVNSVHWCGAQKSWTWISIW